MSQLPFVPMPAGEWVNLYSATSISVGTKIVIQNTGSRNVILVDSVTKPTASTGFNVITPKEYLVSSNAPDGAWAKSSGGSKLQVEESEL